MGCDLACGSISVQPVFSYPVNHQFGGCRYWNLSRQRNCCHMVGYAIAPFQLSGPGIVFVYQWNSEFDSIVWVHVQ